MKLSVQQTLQKINDIIAHSSRTTDESIRAEVPNLWYAYSWGYAKSKLGSFFFELNCSRLCLELSGCERQWRCSFGKEKVCIAPLSVHRYFLMFNRAWCTCILCLKSPPPAHFSDKVRVAKLAYLCDIFSLFNELNLCLQGKMTTVFKLAEKVAAFKAKLELWGRRVNRGNLDMFQTLAGILGETEPEHSFSQLVHDHLSLLLKENVLLPNHKRPTNW
ncbi:hypothetical protein AVEN_37436-1 [Araneus ventricosus]|uniref:SCAN domain-containing protein 3 n=1 Tax=Araneus ventricosus TaxID=182803 RepID=A0A4Y2FAU3_ARAVE|nr:hypothetical protein AVEN_37436-1 [Araneus ventricosus]